jgi:hypothetical protein
MHRDGMEWGGFPPGRGGESCVHQTEDRQGDGCNEEDAGRDVRMRNLRLTLLIPEVARAAFIKPRIARATAAMKKRPGGMYG